MPQEDAPSPHGGSAATPPTGLHIPLVLAAAIGLYAATRLLRRLWGALAAWPLLNRVSDDELLAHPVRARFMEIIEEAPGIHFRGVVRAAQVGEGQAKHHLSVLEIAGLVQSVKVGARRCYFPQPPEPSQLAGLHAVHADTAREILRSIVAEPGVEPAKVRRSLRLTSGNFYHHLRRLDEAGLVEAREGPGGERMVRATKQGIGRVRGD